VPWCETCSKFFNPPSLAPGGECPTCGRVLVEQTPVRAPWHFKLLVAALAVYLGFRAWQGLDWVWHLLH
jgi:DNA-directed RNA polymerase subunit RPC12/RpoP